MNLGRRSRGRLAADASGWAFSCPAAVSVVAQSRTSLKHRSIVPMREQCGRRRAGKRDGETMELGRALWVLGLSALISLMVSLTAFAMDEDTAPSESSELKVGWLYRPTDLADLTAASDAVVVATVMGTDSLGPGPADGEKVDFDVDQVISGSMPSTFSLVKVGLADAQPAGDPAYVGGERYLLFVRKRLPSPSDPPEVADTYIATAPDGRYEIVANRLQAELPGAVPKALDGDSLPQAASEIEDDAE